MTSKTVTLQNLWKQWISASENLLMTLHEQTVVLTLRRVDRVEEIQHELDTQMELMNSIDEMAVTCATELAEELGCKPDLRSLVQVLPKAEAQSVRKIANNVIVAGNDIQRVIAKNRALIENELDYINGTMALIARESETAQGPYSGKRKFASVLMNQVA